MITRSKKVLRREDDLTVEQVQLPKWDRQGQELSTEQKRPQATEVEDVAAETLSLPTLAEIEAIQENAYNEGFEQGYEQGLPQGQREGHVQGLKEGQSEGYEAGLQEGLAAGKQQALAEYREQSSEKLAVLDSLAAALRTQISAEQTELESALLVMVMRIARQVVLNELADSERPIQQLVHAAVQSLPNADSKLTVALNPDDIAAVEAIAEPHWQLQSKEDITRGGCEVTSGYSYVDYTLEHRFDTAVRNLISHMDDVDVQQVQRPFSDTPLSADKPLPADEKADDQPAQAIEDSAVSAVPEAEQPDNSAESLSGNSDAEMSAADTLEPEDVAAISQPSEETETPPQVSETDSLTEAQETSKSAGPLPATEINVTESHPAQDSALPEAERDDDTAD